jgi:protein-disulfide isomerase
MRARTSLPVVVLLHLLASAARGQTPACDALEKGEKAVSRAVLDRAHPYDCCDDTITRCLAAKERCSLAVRLADDVCRQAKAGRDAAAIEKGLARRAQSMVALGAPAQILLDEATRAGDPEASVTVAVYACSRCPFCKVLVPALHREVAEGALKGKVKLYVRPFPLKSHEHSNEGDLAMLAAARLGRFWPFLLREYERFDSFKPEVLGAWAAEVGLEREAFERTAADAATRDALVEAKKEGLRNKVAATPAVFVDGRPYVYELQLEPLLDVLLEAHERLAARKR